MLQVPLIHYEGLYFLTDHTKPNTSPPLKWLLTIRHSASLGLRPCLNSTVCQGVWRALRHLWTLSAYVPVATLSMVTGQIVGVMGK